jgi:hypothetical protein
VDTFTYRKNLSKNNSRFQTVLDLVKENQDGVPFLLTGARHLLLNRWNWRDRGDKSVEGERSKVTSGSLCGGGGLYDSPDGFIAQGWKAGLSMV